MLKEESLPGQLAMVRVIPAHEWLPALGQIQQSPRPLKAQ